MITEETLQELVETHGTPLFVIDHDELRNNYATFKKNLPRVQAYYAVKANPDPVIVKTLFEEGASFDISSIKLPQDINKVVIKEFMYHSKTIS